MIAYQNKDGLSTLLRKKQGYGTHMENQHLIRTLDDALSILYY